MMDQTKILLRKILNLFIAPQTLAGCLSCVGHGAGSEARNKWPRPALLWGTLLGSPKCQYAETCKICLLDAQPPTHSLLPFCTWRVDFVEKQIKCRPWMWGAYAYDRNKRWVPVQTGRGMKWSWVLTEATVQKNRTVAVFPTGIWAELGGQWGLSPALCSTLCQLWT